MAGSISRLESGRWRARYRDAAGGQHTKVTKRKVDAQQWLDDATASIQRGDWIDPKRARVTVSSVAETWMSNPSWKETTRARNRSILRNYVLPKWGPVQLINVQHDDLQAWVTDLSSKDIAANTVRKIEGVLSGILESAVAAKRLPSNPMKGVNLPAADAKRRRYLDDVQVKDFAHCAGDNAAVVYVLAYCGLRIGELAALRVQDVNVTRRRLTIEQSMTEVDGKAVFSTPKDYQIRNVPWPAFLDDMIAAQVQDKDPKDFLFPSSRGGVLRYRNMRRDWWDVAAEDAGLEGLTPHEMRHTAASLAVRSGASVLAVQKMLGHEKASVTLDVYTDLFDEDLDTLADRITSARAEALEADLRQKQATEKE